MATTVQIIHVETSYGRLALRTVGAGDNPPLLCIHGNSSSSEIFKHVLESNISSTRPVLAIDLPGHGQSEHAKMSRGIYTMPGYAKACVEVLTKLDYKEAVVIGWSLGGHIATEMLPLFPGLKGLAIVGALLVPIWDAPLQDDRTKWNMRQDLTEEDLTNFAKHGTGGPYEEWMAKAAISTDPRARLTLFENLGFGDCSDQQQLVANTEVPTAVIIGTDEPHLDNSKIKGLKYGNLWSGQPIEIEGGEHCPVWEKPELVLPILEKFLSEVA